MTTWSFAQVRCSVCGSMGEQARIGSSSVFFPPDLDFRPGQLQRLSMSLWLQECASCRYVSRDLSCEEEGAAQVVGGVLYRGVGTDFGKNFLGARFLRRSLIDAARDCPIAAGTHALWAAWSADDANEPQKGVSMRLRAATQLQRTLSSPSTTMGTGSKVPVRLVDILRRAGQWKDAVELADRILCTPSLDDLHRSMVIRGRALALREDSGCYSVADLDAPVGTSTMVNGRPAKTSSDLIPRARLRDRLSAFFGRIGAV